MSRSLFVALALAAIVVTGAHAQQPASISDTGRPAADVERDAARKPADMLVLAGMKSGDSVLELLPGGGYFTRIFSKEIGPTGHLYAAVPDPKSSDAEPAAAAIAALPEYSNVTVVPIAPLPALPLLDVIWTSWNYHDFHLSRLHSDMAKIDANFFKMLKPGGVMVIVDHVALPGSPPVETADKLHRIDPAVVKTEMQAAGFVFDGESDVLKNPADPHTAIVFDSSIRGKTDQFAFRFRKPM